MLLDNQNENLKVHEWIAKYTSEGKFDVVTGYFTISALAYLSKNINEKIEAFRFVLGDIVNIGSLKEKTLDLLNENITIDAALRLSGLAREAVEFLQQEKVLTKTLEPNFCHAKAYIFKAYQKDPQKEFFITGSSNLTEAGVGLKPTQNIELNIAGFGSDLQYKELSIWFETLWKRPQAHSKKTLLDDTGKEYKKDFKQYLIDEIQRIFIEYTPKELYFKVLFELFGNQILKDQDNPEFNRQVGRLENSVIYNSLYDFQQKGVLSLIKILQKYNGAILADAVGLGKTWSALAIMKFYQLQGREVILLCPKKLQFNWLKYLKNQNSRFERDKFEYFIRFHTDLQPERLDSYNDRDDKYFINEKPKLFVIDESHNLRNDKSKRYRFLADEILRANEDFKILMLSATPINNSLQDIRNQFKLIVQGDPTGYYDSLGIRNIDYTFRAVQKSFNEWREETKPSIGEFIKKLPANFFKLTDSLIVARTRNMIAGEQNNLKFPQKEKPENLFITPNQIGNFESFEELFDHFPKKLSGYRPSFYLNQTEKVDILHDERQREMFLVKMMYILMVKRLESSWLSFYKTVDKILTHHQNALDKIKAYEDSNANDTLNTEDQVSLFDDEELEEEFDNFTLGKKSPVALKDIEDAGNINVYKRHLKKDIESLQLLVSNLKQFEISINNEINRADNFKSRDDKLTALINIIHKKQAIKNGNRKVVIFTVYKDTAFYLFKQLKERGFNRLAVISGDSSRTDDSKTETKLFEPILERFAPFTKLFMEKEWNFTPGLKNSSLKRQYIEWIQWLAANDSKTYKKVKNPIDILIATDVLSEGQNLQDCDMVINYDIHWNPVRIIQRMGRIDRLGSPNKKIYGINFWPSNNINTYLNLQGRIEQRMAAMKLAGSEVNIEFSETFKEIAFDEKLEQKQKARMLELMQTTWDDIEINEQGLGFDDLSLERYRQDLLYELEEHKKRYREMPKGVYTGFKADKEICPEPGIIALLGYPARPAKIENHSYMSYDLIYIDKNGKQVLLNQKEVLDALTLHKDSQRYVPEDVERGEEKSIKALSDAVHNWLESQAVEEEKQPDGTVKIRMGKTPRDILDKIKTGDKNALSQLKLNKTVSDKFKPENFDLIVWFLVN